MAAIVSPGTGMLSLLEEGTGFLVTFALEVMPQIGGGVGGQLQGQFVQPRKEGAQVGLGWAGSHSPGRLFQFQQRVKNLVFRLCHNPISQPSILRAQREKSMAKNLLPC
jgi:hypothetical protein